MKTKTSLNKIKALYADELPPLALLRGDLVVAAPAAERLARWIGESRKVEVQVHRRPSSLGAILDHLQTFSLFGGGKVSVVIDSGLMADTSVASQWMAEVRGVLPVKGGELSRSERDGAIRLLQVIRLFGLDPHRGSARELLADLPAGSWFKKKTKASRIEEVVQQAGALLEAARDEGLEGLGAEELGRLAELFERGLPTGHALILAESMASSKHPLVQALEERGLVVDLGAVSSDRKGFHGLDGLVAELSRETGVEMDRGAVEELSRRTLQLKERSQEVDPASTARFAAEYRKLAGVATGRITRAEVAKAVEDRGAEDVWKILDAVAEGRGGEALTRLDRLLAGASDENSALLPFFSLVANFCRQMVAIQGITALLRLPTRQSNYFRFKSDLAPKISGTLPGNLPNPVARLHPFRLHRAYLAAGRMPVDQLETLPCRLLEVEMGLKGESRDPKAVMTSLLADLAYWARQ